MDALAGIKTRIKKKHDCKNTCDIKQQYIGPRLPASKWTGCAHRMWPKFDKKWKYIDKPRKSNGNYDVRRLTYVIEQGLLYSKNFGLRYSFEFYLMSTGEQSRLYVKNIHNNNLIKRLTISVLLATPSKIWSKLQLSLNSRPLLVFYLAVLARYVSCSFTFSFKAWQTANSQKRNRFSKNWNRFPFREVFKPIFKSLKLWYWPIPKTHLWSRDIAIWRLVFTIELWH